jgi:hypothetical protein
MKVSSQNSSDSFCLSGIITVPILAIFAKPAMFSQSWVFVGCKAANTPAFWAPQPRQRKKSFKNEHPGRILQTFLYALLK